MAAQDRTDTADALTGLNLIWPGLAQLVQGRLGAAAFFAAEALAVIVLLVALPDWRILTLVGMFVLTALSILDALATRNTD
jgi:hypothetical protein